MKPNLKYSIWFLTQNWFLPLAIILLFSSCRKRETDAKVYACIENSGLADSSILHPKNAGYTQMVNDLTSLGIPGISLMIEDEYGLWFKSSGYADIKHKTKMQTCHISKIASVTKLFTAVMIYRLADLGKINLNDALGMYLDAKLISRIKNAEKARIRDLLAHSSGIYDIVFDPEFILYTFNNLDKDKSYEKLLNFAFGKDEEFAYNSGQVYNQTLNHVLLAMVVNEVSGADQSVMLRNEIFSPLKMQSSYIRPQENLPWQFIAKGYYDYRQKGILQDLTPLFTGDGRGFTGIYSTVNDLRLFINALFRERTLLSNAMYNEMVFKTDFDSSLGCAGGCRAMKIQVGGNTYTWYGHPGGEGNYAAGAFYCPEKKATITYTVNYGVAFTKLGAYTDAYFNFRKRLFEIVSE